MNKTIAHALRIFALTTFAATACSKSAPQPVAEPAITAPATPAEETAAVEPKPGESVTRWVAGTPSYGYGEGYGEMHFVADSSDGPWKQSLELNTGESSLAFGKVHQVKMSKVMRPEGIQDVGAWYWQLESVVESKVGGPPVRIHPGSGVAGIRLEHLTGESAVDQWGPFTVTKDASTPSISIPLADVGSVQFGDTVITSGTSLDKVAAAFDGCKKQAIRGGSLYKCKGIDVSEGGPVGDGSNISLVVHQ